MTYKNNLIHVQKRCQNNIEKQVKWTSNAHQMHIINNELLITQPY
jgi:hypothetical protein